MSRAATTFLCILTVGCLLCSQAYPEIPKEIAIAANGGVMEEAPENTMAAFELAVEQGATVLMLDVRSTKDGKLVVIRDETIDRTTNGKGDLGELLYDELKLYDASSWLDKRFRGEPVPLLQEVIGFAKTNGLKVILDVKEQGLEKELISLVQELGMMKAVYFWGALRNLREIEPSLPGPSLLFLSPDEMTPSNIEQAHRHRKEVMTSFLKSDNREKMREVMLKGPDIILVDFPAVAADILERQRPKKPLSSMGRRRALTVVPFNRPTPQQLASGGDKKEKKIDILDPLGTLYNLLVGQETKKERKGKRRSPTVKKEVGSLSRTLREPDIEEKGIFGRTLRRVNKGLSEEEVDKSRKAALKMTTLSPEVVVPTLLNALRYKRPAVRANAAWALGLIGNQVALQDLIQRLGDNNLEVRREAVLALGRLKDPGAIEALTKELLGAAPLPVKFDAARALGEIADPRATGDLARVMLKNPDWRIKGACASALGKIADPGAAEALGSILMGNSADPFSSWTRAQAAWALSALREEAMTTLLNALKDDEEITRMRAAWALTRIGSPSLPTVIKALRDTDPRVRERAAFTLGWIRDSKAVPSLLRTLYDEDTGVRRGVIWALGRIGDPRAKEALDDFLNAERDIRVKEMAGEALLRISKR